MFDEQHLEQSFTQEKTFSQKEKLLRLADKLEGKGPYAEVGPVKTFDIREFYITTEDLPVSTQLVMEGSCGTSACAVGWAALDPWFQDQGFTASVIAPEGYLMPTFRNVAGVKASQEFFSLTWVEFNHLFMPDGYASTTVGPRPTQFEVARQIREFVEEL